VVRDKPDIDWNLQNIHISEMCAVHTLAMHEQCFGTFIVKLAFLPWCFWPNSGPVWGAISQKACQIKAKHLYQHMGMFYVAMSAWTLYVSYLPGHWAYTTYTIYTYTHIHGHIEREKDCWALHSSFVCVFFMQISLQSVGFFPRLAAATVALCINFKFPSLCLASLGRIYLVAYP